MSKEPDTAAGQDQATDAALEREAEADRLFSEREVSETTVPPGPPQRGCGFCEGTGIVTQASYEQAVADGLGRIAWPGGSRCPCTYTWAEIAGSVADICREVADGERA